MLRIENLEGSSADVGPLAALARGQLCALLIHTPWQQARGAAQGLHAHASYVTTLQTVYRAAGGRPPLVSEYKTSKISKNQAKAYVSHTRARAKGA